MAKNTFLTSPFETVAPESDFTDVPMPGTAAPAPAPVPAARTAPANPAPVARRGTLPTTDDIIKRATELNVDPNLALSFFAQESSANWNSKDSPKGARGGMQVMPGTYKMMMGTEAGQEDPWNNLEAGLRYIRYGQNRLKTRDPELLAAGYHAGYDHPELKAGRIPNTSDGMISTRDYARSMVNRVGGGKGSKAASDEFEDVSPGRQPANDEFEDVVPGQTSPIVSAEAQKKADSASYLDRLSEETAAGFGDMTRSLEAARWALGAADDIETAQKIADGILEQRNKPRTTAQQEIDAAYEDVSKAEGVVDTTVAGAKALYKSITNPKETSIEIARSAANSLPTLASGAAGAGGGALAGAIGGVPGAIGGAIVGGKAGMAAGTTATELGAEIQFMVQKRLDESRQPPTAQNVLAILKDEGFKGEALKQGLAKGLTVAAIDQLFMGIGGKIATAPARKEAARTLGEQGVDVSTRKARNEALATPAGRAAVEAANPSIGARVGAGAAAIGVDAAGESIGEGASQKVARGEVDYGDALREGVTSIGQSAAQTAAGVAIERGKQAIDIARSTIRPTANAPSQAAGPLARAAENAATQPDRVTVKSPEGEVSGTVTGTAEDGTMQVVSDDGEVLTFKPGENGLTIEPEAPNTPLSNALEVAAEDQPDTEQQETEQPAAQAEATPEQAVTTPPVELAQPAPVEAPQAAEPAKAPVSTPPQADYASMDEPALRERLKYLGQQAKNNGGWNTTLIKERKKVERAINALPKAEVPKTEELKLEAPAPVVQDTPAQQAADQEPVTQPVTSVVTEDGSSQPSQAAPDATDIDVGTKPAKLPFASKEDTDRLFGVDKKREKALERIAKGTAYFGSKPKADEFITKNGLKDTHTVAKGKAGRWDIVEKEVVSKKETPNQEQANVTDERTEQQPDGAEAVVQEADAGQAEGVAVQPAPAQEVSGIKVGDQVRDKKSGRFATVGKITTDGDGKPFIADDTGRSFAPMSRVEKVSISTSDSKAVNDFIEGKRPDAPNVEEIKAEQQTEKLDNATSPTGKEPSTQTAGDWHKARIESLIKRFNFTEEQAKEAQAEPIDWMAHQDFLETALDEGKEIPEPVLADYRANGVKIDPKEHPKLAKLMGGKTPEPTPPNGDSPFAKNTIFTQSAVDKARARLKSKLNQINAGIDPEMVMDGMTIAGAYIESGTRTFAAYSKAMVEDLGDKVKPYLLSFYEAARNYPGVDSDGMSSPSSARAQFEALMLDDAEVQKAKARSTLKERPTPKDKENDNGSEKLDQPGARALEGAQPDLLQGTEPDGQAGSSPARGGRADARGDERAGGPGVQQSGRMGDDPRDVPAAAPRADAGRGGEQGSRAVPAGQRAAKPDPVERDAGNQPSLIPESGTRAQDRADSFVITDEDAIGEGGAKTKYKQNIAAIKLLRQLTDENRQATRAEQAVLAKYVGWGGIPQAFYRDNNEVTKGWEKEAAELKELLTPEELDAAAKSTRNAHYTSPEIVQAVWEAAKHFGFKGGRTLEPSVGVGNFFGLMPTDLRSASQLTGVELDRITGGIAKQLYPSANIQAPVGFQDFSAPDNYFDLAIGNPPFGREGIYDAKRRKISGFSIHNYFFAKSIDTVKPNGVLAMVVTNRLLDSVGDKARQYIDQRTEFLGAIRLPNDAFLKNAGTQVTTDIIFLRKLKEGEQPTGHDWLEVKQYRDKNGNLVPLNEYFLRNPGMMLGDFGQYGSMYSDEDAALIARPGQDTPALLKEAIARLPQGFMDGPSAAPTMETIEPKGDISAVKIGSVFEQDGQIFERREDMLGKQQMVPVAFPSDKARERVSGMIKVRDALIDVRRMQLQEGVNEAKLEAARAELNKAYDAFVRANGPLNADANKRLMRDDPSWPQIAALEDDFDKGVSATVAKNTGEKARAPSAKKAAIFSKRTQSPYKAPVKASSAKDAMVSSLAERGRVDLDYISSLYPKTSEAIARELEGLIYKNPVGGWEAREQYLSGNVKKKLAQAIEAAKADPAMKANVEALKAVQPADIEAVDIDVKTGAHWVPADVMTEFVETISQGRNVKTLYNPITASWTFAVDGIPQSASTQWGTDRAGVTKILEAAANQKQITIYDEQRDGSRILNEAATTAANQKVERVKAEWKNWIWNDDARRVRLSRIYNDTFNTDVQREFDGSHLKFPGKVGDDIINLRPHQANAIWRMVQSGTTLLDHIVGAGKTFTMIGGIMEMRRMGIAKKPVLVVPNHLVGQWAVDFMKLYPGANILAATKKDFEKDNRKKLFARIATGDWDAVIIAHSSFGKVEVEPEFQEEFIRQQIADMDTSISAMRAAEGKSSRNVKQIEKQKAALEEKLKKLFDTGSKDDNLYFSELGIDAVLVDEAHEFKNLGFSTGMQRVAGLGNPSGSNKAADMFMKVQATLKRTGGRNVVFATGTPISNTMAEMYTMQRFLDYQTLKDQGIAHFDAWAKTFGEVVTDWELSPSGQYKMNSRFAKFVNMPELMQRYQSFADVVNRDDINRMLAVQGKKLPVPRIKGGKPENTVVPRSDLQASYIGVPKIDENGMEQYPEGSLVYRAENMPKKAEKGSDNMLKIMSDARKAALDMRLIDPSYPDNPGSKVNVSADNIKEIYDQWSADKGTQLVFIDLSTPKNAKGKEAAALREIITLAEQGDEAAQEKLDRMSPDELLALDSQFSVYDDLKQKLIDRGIPENEIAFIHDAGTEIQKEDLFGKVRSGRVRVLFGSTAKMGAGMNVQDRLVALHHLDAPWRPSDLEQREGRIIRQGNKLYEANPEGFEIRILRYATKQTLDSRMWQTIEAKARFIEQVRKGSGAREVEDVAGEAANSAEMKAASSGNPLILEEMTLRQTVRKLENQQSEHNREQYRIKDRIRSLESYDRSSADRLKTMAQDVKKIPEAFLAKVGNETFDKHGKAGEAILAAMELMHRQGVESREIGSYGGFKLKLDDTSAGKQKTAVLSAVGTEEEYQVNLNGDSDPTGLALRLQNLVKSIPEEIEIVKRRVEANKADIPKLQSQIGEWKQAGELAEAKQRHAEVIEQLRPKKKEQPAKEGENPALSRSQEQERMRYIDDNFFDILGELEDSGKVIIKC